ncbi:N-acetyl-1-D-myo-inositol-2-amino-2-deoxy-alpha-D-glucopyranoside deacetylase [Solwaraspora sp. WMMD1047]|uniref:N-acetyl-1-D-myo-inositol-2-amino-2-deoxy-alpha- D-glucopyranoside deacetylase n=1 Tax=Solwaraspora sp. WMMD1047 TaxID=3016102 RepID=UPI002417BE91|nr:N-acetyl-1-D-myo-inositol-2-amino-2-deoxy-alpha-D-glucopyranoside deacetylase [Solwaraspora sp. WMMD1047]MDG4829907.1 N-acetyl-1-D-myo-inositol-2-amino-2-deoxy-alpha-D-glucopyranoside deacetylase [Solwaraspora sp. WMMD1047]
MQTSHPDRDGNPLRLLLVHAHPDDETTTTGATIARYAAEGVGVTLVTCTRGERGEILDPTVDTSGAADPADALGQHRLGELAAAAAALGVTDVRLLGGAGTWWDSGMAGTDTTTDPRAFSAGDHDLQTSQLVAILRQVRPQVVISYDERGGYGHPDHIRAHDIAASAVVAAADPTAAPTAGPPWVTSKLYAAVVPVSLLAQAMTTLAGARLDGPNPFAEVAAAIGGPPNATEGPPGGADSPLAQLPFGVPDAAVTTRIDARDWLPAKAAAMRAHRSQMHANGWFFALAEDPGRGFGVEHYQLLRGRAEPPAPGEPETDLFAGLRPAPDSSTDSNLEVAVDAPGS